MCLKDFVSVRVGRQGVMLGPRGISFLAHYSRVHVESQHQGSPPTPARLKGGCCRSLSPGLASIQLEHVFPQAHTQYKQGQTNTPEQTSVHYLGIHKNMNSAAQFSSHSLPDQDRSLIVEYIHLPGNNIGLSSN